MQRDDAQSIPSQSGALLLHGLTSSPGEVRALKEFLESRGIVCRSPRLPGHETSLRDLGFTSHLKWLECARAELSTLKAQTGRVFIIGESLGALLGLILASEIEVSGVVALSTPFGIATHRRLLQALSYLPDPLLGYLGTKPKPPRPEGSVIHAYPNYPAHHLGAGARLFKLQRMLVSCARMISCPVLLLQDPHDNHLALDSSDALARLLPHATVELYPNGSHQLLCGRMASDVFNRIEAFLRA